jgi:hypothetical protein
MEEKEVPGEGMPQVFFLLTRKRKSLAVGKGEKLREEDIRKRNQIW